MKSPGSGGQAAQRDALIAEARRLLALGRHAQGEQRLRLCLTLAPRDPAVLNELGVLLRRTGRAGEAARLLQDAQKASPGNAAILNNLGNALKDLGRHDEALAAYGLAVAAAPGHVHALVNRGELLAQLGRRDAAIRDFGRAAELDPRNADAPFGLGTLLFAEGHPAEAAAAFERAGKADPRFAAAHFNAGIAHQESGDAARAVACYDAVLRLDPRHALALGNRGVALQRLQRHAEALRSLDAAVALAAQSAEAHFNRGVSLQALGDLRAALASFERATSLDAGLAEAHNNCAVVLEDLGELEAALAAFRRAHALKPGLRGLAGSIFFLEQRLCIWEGYAAKTAAITAGLAAGEEVTLPFPVIVHAEARATLNRACTLHAEGLSRLAGPVRSLAPRRPAPKLRIGYFSADFHNHATSYLIAELLELHDRTRFDVSALSFGPANGDAMQSRLRQAVHSFHDVAALGDGEICALADRLQLDIAIDLKGYTQGARGGVFMRRAAPLQVNYLGFPGSLCSGQHDYIVADRVLIPPGAEQDYAEKVIFLSGCYQPNDRKRPIAAAPQHRRGHGLPEHGFVFCSFNNGYKLTPMQMDLWAAILGAVPESVLWLLADNAAASANLRREAAARGIDPARLVFAPRLPLAEHLARQRLADLFLDSYPCTAHTTASDALWAGLPVLTRPGETFASRVAASLLTAAGLPELVTATANEYRDTAIALAVQPHRLLALRQRLTRDRLHLPLFDTPQYVRHLERAFELIHERHSAGQPPDHVSAVA